MWYGYLAVISRFPELERSFVLFLAFLLLVDATSSSGTSTIVNEQVLQNAVHQISSSVAFEPRGFCRFLEDVNDPVMFTTLAFAIRIVEGLGAGGNSPL